MNDRKALHMFAAGIPFDEIAEMLGYKDADAARAAVERRAAVTTPELTKDMLRKKLHIRYELLFRAVWTKAMNPKSDEQLAAIRLAGELGSRYSKLFGLDAPAEVNVYTPAAIQMERWVGELIEGSLAALPAEADVVSGEIVEPDES